MWHAYTTADIPIPKNHVYPDEPNKNHTSEFKENQPKYNAWFTKHRAEQQNKYNRNNAHNKNENTHYHANNEIPNQDNNRPRSEYKQYVFAFLNSVRAKLLPVRIYLTPQGMITTAEDGITAEREADPRITGTIIIPATTARMPTMPGTGLPDTANRLIRLTANTDR